MERCFRLFLFFLLIYSVQTLRAQLEHAPLGRASFGFDLQHFNGAIVLHNPDIAHLITNHPSGLLISMNRRTQGAKLWQQVYNYPDWGVSFIAQDMGNDTLGDVFGLYAHYNFYLFHRRIQFRTATGIAYATNPYDPHRNFRNVAYGTSLLSSTYLMLNYRTARLFDTFGFQIGLGVVHYSNGNFRAPNKSTNTAFFNMGVHYDFERKNPLVVFENPEGVNRYREPLQFQGILRAGVNESDVVGSGQYSFYTLGVSLGKRLTRRNRVDIGAEFFWSKALNEYIKYRSVADFNDGVTGEEDGRRAGVFVGHDWVINAFSIVTQLGYYVYYPFDFEGRLYNRLGLRYDLIKELALGLTVRSHGAKAEAVELSFVIRI